MHDFELIYDNGKRARSDRIKAWDAKHALDKFIKDFEHDSIFSPEPGKFSLEVSHSSLRYLKAELETDGVKYDITVTRL